MLNEATMAGLFTSEQLRVFRDLATAFRKGNARMGTRINHGRYEAMPTIATSEPRAYSTTASPTSSTDRLMPWRTSTGSLERS
jgi:hypothetical protein